MTPTVQEFGPCPCMHVYQGTDFEPVSCGVQGTKLKRNGHLVGCRCRPCIGLRNKRAGKATEARRHRNLGGTGGTPRDELAYAYSINITTEDKHGQQIPANFTRFLELDWTRRALRQAEKKLPVGSDALPALYLDCGRSGSWLVVRVPTKGLR